MATLLPGAKYRLSPNFSLGTTVSLGDSIRVLEEGNEAKLLSSSLLSPLKSPKSSSLLESLAFFVFSIFCCQSEVPSLDLATLLKFSSFFFGRSVTFDSKLPKLPNSPSLSFFPCESFALESNAPKSPKLLSLELCLQLTLVFDSKLLKSPKSSLSSCFVEFLELLLAKLPKSPNSSVQLLLSVFESSPLDRNVPKSSKSSSWSSAVEFFPSNLGEPNSVKSSLLSLSFWSSLVFESKWSESLNFSLSWSSAGNIFPTESEVPNSPKSSSSLALFWGSLVLVLNTPKSPKSFSTWLSDGKVLSSEFDMRKFPKSLSSSATPLSLGDLFCLESSRA